MDLLDFDPEELYFEQPDSDAVQQLIQQAGSSYRKGDAELPLLQAFMRAPSSLNVLVALNRFYYYQHRLDEALLVSEKALVIIGTKLPFPFPAYWKDIEPDDIARVAKELLSWVRLYLFTLKSIGFLKMRLLQLDESKAIFEKLVELDSEDRMGARGLLKLVLGKIEENDNVFRLY